VRVRRADKASTEMLRKRASLFQGEVAGEVCRWVEDFINGVVRAASDVVASVVMSITQVTAHTDRNVAVSTIRSINEDSTGRLNAASGNRGPAQSHEAFAQAKWTALQITHPEQVVGLATINVAAILALCVKGAEVRNMTTGSKRTSDELSAFVVGLTRSRRDDLIAVNITTVPLTISEWLSAFATENIGRARAVARDV
jgi:hypothetical protein